MIAFLGAGLLGSGFVRAALRRGEQVRVWNRSFEKALALEAAGAKAARDPSEAVENASRIHLALADDAAVDAVLDAAVSALAPDTLILDHTTTSCEGVIRRSESWASRGMRYVHAPVFMGPQNALDATGLMLVSGPRVKVDAAKPFLEPMTGTLVDLGERVDAAAAYKLLGNAFLMFLTSGLADFFMLSRALNIEPSDAAGLFRHFNPGAAIPARAARMLGADWSNPSWTLAMARKDARLMIEAAERAGRPLAVLPAITERMDTFVERGHGGDDWTVLGKDAL
jgi:3-hydroxyisobutyrate dehydrogenase